MNAIIAIAAIVAIAVVVTAVITRRIVIRTSRSSSSAQTAHRSASSKHLLTPAVSSGVTMPQDASPPVKPIVNSWRIEGDDGPLLEVTQSPSQGAGKELPQELTRVISPLVERLPSLATALSEMTTGCYRIVFKPEIMKGLQSGSLELMKASQGGFRLTAISKSGKIIAGQGSVIKVGKALQLATAGFQVASFVTGQAHLAQINERLAAIESKVDDVLNFLRDARMGQLAGNIEYLRNQIAFVLNDRLHELDLQALNNRIEAIEQWCIQTAHTARIELDRHEEEVRSLDLHRWFKTATSDQDQLCEKRDRCLSAARVLVMSLEIRILANELKAIVLVDYGLTKSRRDELQRTLNEALERLEKLSNLLNRRTQEINGKFRRKVKLEEMRARLRSATSSQIGDGRMQCQSMQSTLRSGVRFEGDRDHLLTNGLCIELARSMDGSWAGKLLSENVQQGHR